MLINFISLRSYETISECITYNDTFDILKAIYLIHVADDLRSSNCDVTSISGMTKSCFFNLVDTLD